MTVPNWNGISLIWENNRLLFWDLGAASVLVVGSESQSESGNALAAESAT